MLKKLITLFILAIFLFTSFVKTATAQTYTPEQRLEILMSSSKVQELFSRYINSLKSFENKRVETLDLALEFAYQFNQVFPATIENNTYTIEYKMFFNSFGNICAQVYNKNPKHEHLGRCGIILIATGLFDIDEDVFATLAAYTDYATLNDQEKNNLYYLKQPLLNRLFAQNNLDLYVNTKPYFVNFTVKLYPNNLKYLSTTQDLLKSFNITLVE
ncbi:hypothetical protein [Psittacicella gerlachiana]|uniref:Uncharacterized protein n=1 Tax=Psittacicella gerlachiana TaxID=2028574 RepID=A0A3A1YRZ7_9GAMM|nr:hypothetical protein [Psittacicella gerlachiana]RIY38797.1 hypothetical protein CKF59_00260 [Psittacicella gerlachiana]